MIQVYDLTRTAGPGQRAVALCDRHAEARKVIGWTLHDAREPFAPVPQCDDCAAARRNPTVLDRAIASADAVAAADEPEPVRVLPGQRRLF